MGTITGYTAARMKQIEDNVVVDGDVNGSGHLILTKHNGGTIDAGSVIGPTGPEGPAGASVPIGACVPYFGLTEPSGWKFPNGQEVSRTTYAALFAIIGTTYGVGNGSTTFNLPDIRDRVVVQSVDGSDLGNTGGAKTVTLTANEMPTHSHGNGTYAAANAGAHTHNTDSDTAKRLSSATYGDTSSNVVEKLTFGPLPTTSAGAHTHDVTGTSSTAGTGGAHENMPPYIVCNQLMRVA